MTQRRVSVNSCNNQKRKNSKYNLVRCRSVRCLWHFIAFFFLSFFLYSPSPMHSSTPPPLLIVRMRPGWRSTCKRLAVRSGMRSPPARTRVRVHASILCEQDESGRLNDGARRRRIELKRRWGRGLIDRDGHVHGVEVRQKGRQITINSFSRSLRPRRPPLVTSKCQRS